MTNKHPLQQITLEEVLQIVSFTHTVDDTWVVEDVRSDVFGHVDGIIYGSVKGNIYGSVQGIGGSVYGSINGTVKGKIAGLDWKFVETPKEKFRRLLGETGNQELIDAFYQIQLEHNW